jgi:hypothetical protein
VPPSEALSEEKQVVLAYARKHPELRRRERAWRMVDEDVAYVSPSRVYRILKEANLVCPWRRRAKRKQAAEEKATRPIQRRTSDVMRVQAARRVDYYVAFLDDNSQYILLKASTGCEFSGGDQPQTRRCGEPLNPQPGVKDSTTASKTDSNNAVCGDSVHAGP